MKLKEDFKYNLHLLSERDAELEKYDSVFNGRCESYYHSSGHNIANHVLPVVRVFKKTLWSLSKRNSHLLDKCQCII